MKLPEVPKPDDLINTAFSRARKKAVRKRKIKDREMMRIDVAANVVLDTLHAIARLDMQLWSPFYMDLAEATVDSRKLKTAIQTVDWAKRKILDMKRKALLGYTKLGIEDSIGRRKAFYGRLDSVVRSLDKDLDLIRECYATLSSLPDIKDLPTVIIAGFPNAGKSSILKALTGSEPDIQPYPFTTKGLMMGYSRLGYQKVQFIDTPGLLDRPMTKRNDIEMRAIAALKNLNALVLFVVDPFYDLAKQLKLLEEIKGSFGARNIVVVNKCDMEFERADVEKTIKGPFISAKSGEGIEGLKESIGKTL